VSQPKIVLYGDFGSGNIGNDASLEAALFALQQRRSPVEVTCICTGPQVVAERYGLETWPVDTYALLSGHEAGNRLVRVARRVGQRLIDEVKFWLRRKEQFPGLSQFVVVGTGSLDDMGMHPWNSPYNLFKWGTAARLAGAEIVFLSVGVGPIKNRLSRRLMLTPLKWGSYRSYRDVVSKQYLESVGFDTDGDEVYPDLVFSLPMAEAQRLTPAAVSPRTIGLGVMGYYGWHLEGGERLYGEYLAKLKGVAHWLLERGYKLRLLTGQMPIDQRPVDDLLAFVKAEGQPDWPARVIAEPMTTISDLFAQISQTDLVIATRFHNVLCALMLNRPVISIGYAKKNDALLAEMGLAAYCQHIETFSVEKLMEQFEALVAEAGPVARRIADKNMEYRRQLDEQYQAVLHTEPALVAVA
jgi:polysaccharide pyruvyl transferase WcaK-like protein